MLKKLSVVTVPFTYVVDGYTMSPPKFKRVKGRRGVTTTCEIMDASGKPVCVLVDTPDEIVAMVDFANAKYRAPFLKAARKAGHKMDSENFAISEYARDLTMRADAAWSAAIKAARK